MWLHINKLSLCPCSCVIRIRWMCTCLSCCGDYTNALWCYVLMYSWNSQLSRFYGNIRLVTCTVPGKHVRTVMVPASVNWSACLNLLGSVTHNFRHHASLWGRNCCNTVWCSWLQTGFQFVNWMDLPHDCVWLPPWVASSIKSTPSM